MFKRSIYKIIIPIILVLSLASCAVEVDMLKIPTLPPPVDYESVAAGIKTLETREITAQFLESLGEKRVRALVSAFDGGYSTELWYDVTGESLNVLLDKFEGAEAVDLGHNGKDSFEFGFAGDINFHEGSYVMPHANSMPNGVLDCISPQLVEYMKSADVMMVNNEFCYSDRGTPLPEKEYTFRAKPESVEMLDMLGIDIVSLANNHTFDYGEEAFLDTLDIINNTQNIKYVGAGRNFKEASAPVFYHINGRKVAVMAAARTEFYRIFTRQATETECGIMRTHTPTAFLAAIREAKAVSDYVITYVHWGTESTSVLEPAQKQLARQLIDAGASAVFGSHPHVLQGIEFYNDSPVVYSLGNFWFNTKSLDSCMVTLTFAQNGEKLLKYYPCRQSDSETKLLTSEQDRRRLFDYVQSISPGEIVIDNEGIISGT